MLRVARGAVVWLGARRVMGDLVGGESRVVGENIAQNRICAKLAGRTKGREIRGGLGRDSPKLPTIA